MKTPGQKIYVMEGSLRIFTFGLLSLLPPLGLVLAPLVLWRFFSIWSIAGKEFNPARRYLYVGLCNAFVGGLISVLSFLVAVLALIDNF